MSELPKPEDRGRAVKEGPIWIWIFFGAIVSAGVLTALGIYWANVFAWH
jgi:hypothetical protein